MHTLYGSTISYYAGKLESCAIGHAYEVLPHAVHQAEIRAGAGARRPPTDDGLGLRHNADPALVRAGRSDSGLRSIPRTLRSASSRCCSKTTPTNGSGGRRCTTAGASSIDREHASGHLVDEMFAGNPSPRDDLRKVMVERQRGGFVIRDGVTTKARGDTSRRRRWRPTTSSRRSSEERPFLLGRPTHHRRLRVRGADAAPLRPGPDAGGAHAPPRPPALHLGRANVGSEPGPGGRRADRRRSTHRSEPSFAKRARPT